MAYTQIESLLKKGVAHIIDETYLHERLEGDDKFKIEHETISMILLLPFSMMMYL